MTAALSIVPKPRVLPRRNTPSVQPQSYVIARPVTLPIDIADLYREWQRAPDAQLIANARLKTARTPEEKSGLTRSADAAAFRVAMAREAFGTAMKQDAEARR